MVGKCDFDGIFQQSLFCKQLMERLHEEIRASKEGSWSGMENHIRKQDDIKRIRRELLTLSKMLNPWGRYVMADYIDKQKTLNVIFEIAENVINSLPSADVQPVRHGKWIDGKRMGYDGVFVWHRECSECGYERKDDNIDNDTPYCPNCGARMDFEKGDKEK